MNAIVVLDFNTCGLNTDVSSNPKMKTCCDKNAQQDTDYTARLLDVVHNNSSGVLSCVSLHGALNGLQPRTGICLNWDLHSPMRLDGLKEKGGKTQDLPLSSSKNAQFNICFLNTDFTQSITRRWIIVWWHLPGNRCWKRNNFRTDSLCVYTSGASKSYCDFHEERETLYVL